METILDAVIILISLAFLSALGVISGVALPGLFLAAAAPWLDWILPVKAGGKAKKDEPQARSGH